MAVKVTHRKEKGDVLVEFEYVVPPDKVHKCNIIGTFNNWSAQQRDAMFYDYDQNTFSKSMVVPPDKGLVFVYELHLTSGDILYVADESVQVESNNPLDQIENAPMTITRVSCIDTMKRESDVKIGKLSRRFLS